MHKFQGSEDILPDPLCRCRRKCRDHRPHRKLPDKRQDPHIAGTEILSPLRDTVGFIHCDHGNFCMTCKIKKPGRLQTFRCHINNLIPPCRRQFQRFCDLRLGQGAVDVCSVYSCFVECLDLIHHQRDQGGDYHGDPRHQKRRELIAQRFSCSGRHDCKDIPAGKDLVDDLLLSGAEAVIAKIGFQGLYLIHSFSPRCFHQK